MTALATSRQVAISLAVALSAAISALWMASDISKPRAQQPQAAKLAVETPPPAPSGPILAPRPRAKAERGRARTPARKRPAEAVADRAAAPDEPVANVRYNAMARWRSEAAGHAPLRRRDGPQGRQAPNVPSDLDPGDTVAVALPPRGWMYD